MYLNSRHDVYLWALCMGGRTPPLYTGKCWEVIGLYHSIPLLRASRRRRYIVKKSPQHRHTAPPPRRIASWHKFKFTLTHIHGPLQSGTTQNCSVSRLHCTHKALWHRLEASWHRHKARWHGLKAPHHARLHIYRGTDSSNVL